MGLAGPIVAILGGLLAALPFVGAVQPKAKALLEKLAPIQGWLGLVLFVWGLWGIIQFFLYIGLLSVAPLAWLLFGACSVVSVAVGFLLGFGLLSKFIFGTSPVASVKAEVIRGRLSIVQIPLGLTTVVIGLLGLIANLR